MNFREWIIYEAMRIVHMGSITQDEHRDEYMRAQIEAALRKAFAHGKDGLKETDEPRVVS
jgi:hypothetical protein